MNYRMIPDWLCCLLDYKSAHWYWITKSFYYKPKAVQVWYFKTILCDDWSLILWYFREWGLLHNITWTNAGNAFTNVTFGSYAIIILLLGINRLVLKLIIWNSSLCKFCKKKFILMKNSLKSSLIRCEKCML